MLLRKYRKDYLQNTENGRSFRGTNDTGKAGGIADIIRLNFDIQGAN